MIKRTIDICKRSFLSTQLEQLHIEQNGTLVAKVPIEDIGILLLSHPHTVVTQQLITKCAKNNVAVIFCNEKYVPVGLALPLADGHSLHTKVIKSQFSVKKVMKNQLWQNIVSNKIAQQASTLKYLNLPHTGVFKMINLVKSFDKENHEAQAAKLYWKILFNGQFKRDPDADGVNSLLNYGYAIIRATLARAICCAGLHPSIGIFHKNQYNSYCLADDLMEYFRPWIDYLVYQYAIEHNDLEVNQEFKRWILCILDKRVRFADERSPLFIAIQSYVNSYRQSLEQQAMLLNYPQLESLPCLLED